MIELDYRLVLEGIGDAVVAANEAGRIVFANTAAERLFGWSEAALLGQPLTVLIPSRHQSAHTDGFHRYQATRRARLIGRTMRVPVRRLDGEEIDTELSLAAFESAEGHDLFVASFRDLRERVELERQLSLSRYLRATAEASARLGQQFNLDHVLQTVVKTLTAEFDSALARIWLAEEGGKRLRLRASAGLSTRTADSSRAILDVVSYPYKVGEVARTRMPFVKNGLAGDSQFEADWIEAERLASVAAFPLVVGDEFLGVLVHFARKPCTQEMTEALAAFVSIVSAAVHDVQMFHREQQARAQAEDAEQRAAFLAEASTVLAGSLDYIATLTSLAQLAVPRLADWSAVHMREADGSIRLLAVAHRDPARVEWAREFDRRYPPHPDAPHAVPYVLRTGRSELYPEIPEALVAVYAHNPEHRQWLHRLGLCSYMVVPLAARGRTLGTMAFAMAESGRRLGPADLALAEDLARRAGLAVDNARLYKEAQDAIRLRDQFLSVASHELRTPLSPIQLQIQLLLRTMRAGALEKVPRDRLEAMLDTCDRQIRRLVQLINELLDVSQMTAGKLSLHFEELDLSALVREIVERHRPEFQQSETPVTIDAPEPVVGRCDRLRVEQVLGNLLSNALKYGSGQPVAVAVRATPRGVRMSVEDRGIGIAPEHQRRIFERFERAVSSRSYSGLGLGLFIARQIVEALGGTIQVSSAPGQGSTFVVDLPLDAKNGAGSETAPAAREPTPTRRS